MPATTPALTHRPLDAYAWNDVHAALDAQGWALLPGLFDRATCHEVAGWYDDGARFRSRIVMARHGFGRGEYQYFAYPLPALLAELRTGLYPRLTPVATAWSERLGSRVAYPATHGEFVAACHAAGQVRPTPLLLRYVSGDFNALHQDLYGPLVFPLQVAVLLSAPGRDFTGGEFVLTEQRPRLQSRADVVPLSQGDAVVFAVHHRPVTGARGTYRVHLRHGVGTVRSGRRHTLGIILHDAT